MHTGSGETGFDALVLAGGGSRRMGRDKAFLEDRGVPWLARSLGVVRAVGARRVWISGRAGVDYSALETPVLLDGISGQGPLGGIERGLQATTQPFLLVLAVDLWRMHAELLQRIHGAIRATVGAVPRTQRGWEPLVAFYPRQCLPVIQASLREGRLSATAVVREGLAGGWLRTWEVPEEDLAAFANANEPCDLPPPEPDR